MLDPWSVWHGTCDIAQSDRDDDAFALEDCSRQRLELPSVAKFPFHGTRRPLRPEDLASLKRHFDNVMAGRLPRARIQSQDALAAASGSLTAETDSGSDVLSVEGRCMTAGWRNRLVVRWMLRYSNPLTI